MRCSIMVVKVLQFRPKEVHAFWRSRLTPTIFFPEQVRACEPQGASRHHDDPPQDGEHLGDGGRRAGTNPIKLLSANKLECLTNKK